MPDLTEMVNEQMPLGATLGIRTSGTPDEVEATLDWAPELCTAAGVLHGGTLMALADSAGGVWLWSGELVARSADGGATW